MDYNKYYKKGDIVILRVDPRSCGFTAHKWYPRMYKLYTVEDAFGESVKLKEDKRQRKFWYPTVIFKSPTPIQLIQKRLNAL